MSSAWNFICIFFLLVFPFHMYLVPVVYWLYSFPSFISISNRNQDLPEVFLGAFKFCGLLVYGIQNLNFGVLLLFSLLDLRNEKKGKLRPKSSSWNGSSWSSSTCKNKVDLVHVNLQIKQLRDDGKLGNENFYCEEGGNIGSGEVVCWLRRCS